MTTFNPQAKPHPGQYWDGDTNAWTPDAFLQSNTPWNNYNAQNPYGNVNDFQLSQGNGQLVWDPITQTFKRRAPNSPNAAGTVNPGTTDLGAKYEGQKMGMMGGGMNPMLAYRTALDNRIKDRTRSMGSPLLNIMGGGRRSNSLWR